MRAAVILVAVVVVASATPPSEAQCAGIRIQPADGFSGDEFAASALQGDTLLVSALHARDALGRETGAVYAFQRDDRGTPSGWDDDWVQIARFTPSDGADGTAFGVTLLQSGTTALVGAGYRAGGVGAVYFYERGDGGTPADPFDDEWIELQKIVPTGPFPSGSPPRDGFGEALVLHGTTLLVGAPNDARRGTESGVAYCFERDEMGTPLDPLDDLFRSVARLSVNGGQAHERFGTSLGFEADTAWIGVPGDDVGRGAVYWYEQWDNGTPSNPFDDGWIEVRKLTASAPAAGDRFGGGGLVLRDGLALVSATQSEGSGTGEVHAFQRDENGTPTDPFDDAWVELPRIVASDGATGDGFGEGLALEGDRVLIGAGFDDERGADSGAAYLFQRDDGGTPGDPFDDSWTEVEKLVRVAGVAGDECAVRLSLEGGVAVLNAGHVTSSEAPSRATMPGSVYVHPLDEACTAHVGVRDGTGANPGCLTSTSLPRLGTTWTLELDTTGHAAPIYSLLLARDRPLSPGVLVRQGEVLIDLFAGVPVLKTMMLSSPTGTDLFTYQVPVDSSLIGLQVFTQGAVLGGAQGRLCNALDVVLGV